MAKALERPLVVAIDGPAGAGKSTVSMRLTEELGYQLLDTGALYRAVALLARRQGVAWQDVAAVEGIAKTLDVCFRVEDGTNHVIVAGMDVTSAIREPVISQGASIVSAIPQVRQALLDLQRRLGDAGGVVAEGRDVGTVVFPAADVKFFLTASPRVRAQRRYDELAAKGLDVDFDATLKEMEERDERDSGREVAPLSQAEDAVLVDSSQKTLDEVVGSMLQVVRVRAAQ